VVEDPARDCGVRREELDRVEPGALRHDTRGAQGAVAAVGAQLEQPARRRPPDRAIEDLALLVADVDQDAAGHAELVDHADDVVRVAAPSVLGDVFGKRLLATVADLPLAHQRPDAEHHAEHGPAQERKSPAADFAKASHRRRFSQRIGSRPRPAGA
jgi:hypothetical protein